MNSQKTIKNLLDSLQVLKKLINDKSYFHPEVASNEEVAKSMLEKIEDFEKNIVNDKTKLNDYNFKVLYHGISKLFHPDLLTSSENIELIEKTYMHFNTAMDEIKKLKKVGLTLEYRQEQTHSYTQNRTYTQTEYSANPGYRYKTNPYRGSTRYQYNSNPYGENPGYKYKTDAFDLDDDYYEEEKESILKKKFAYLMERFNAHFRKIPANAADFERILRELEEKAKFIELYAGGIQEKIKKLKEEITLVEEDTQEKLKKENIKRIYDENMARTKDELDDVTKKKDDIENEIMDIYHRSRPEIDYQISVWIQKYNNLLNTRSAILSNFYPSPYPRSEQEIQQLRIDLQNVESQIMEMEKIIKSPGGIDDYVSEQVLKGLKEYVKKKVIYDKYWETIDELEEFCKKYEQNPEEQLNSIEHGIRIYHDVKINEIKNKIASLTIKYERYLANARNQREQIDNFKDKYKEFSSSGTAR